MNEVQQKEIKENPIPVELSMKQKESKKKGY